MKKTIKFLVLLLFSLSFSTGILAEENTSSNNQIKVEQKKADNNLTPEEIEKYNKYFTDDYKLTDMIKVYPKLLDDLSKHGKFWIFNTWLGKKVMLPKTTYKKMVERGGLSEKELKKILVTLFEKYDKEKATNNGK